MFSALRTSSVKCAMRTNFSVSVNAIKPGNKISLPLAKIVATIGPASENLDVLPHVVDAGLRIMRINFSHATYEEADLRVKNIKKCRGINAADNAVDGQLNTRSIMLDTQGPEIRTGSFANGVKDIDVVAGDKITLTTDEAFRANQSKDVLWISYRKLYDTLHTGSSILLDDGVIEVTVDSKSKNDKGEANIICTIVNSGNLGNKKGVNMPGLKVDLPAMSEKDKQDIRWGIANDIDYIAASFTRKPSDVEEIRSYAAGLLKELYPTTYSKHAIPRIISKIESTEALDNFDEILAVSDGIMVARGDLAVEIPMESLACVSKEIVRKSALAGKPVIVATQMLESMQKNPRPTRAECTDVANALLDGADAVMLSGESAKGKYPVGAVSMMNRIVQHTEHVHKFTDKLLLPTTTTPRGVFGSLEATAYGAVQAVNASQDVKYVVINLNDSEARLNNVFNERTTTENLTNFISKHRPQVPVLVVVPDHKTGRLLQFYRGVHPIVLSNANGRICDHKIATHLTKLNLVSKNDQIALLSKHDGVVSLSFNTIAH